jgi:hypothetical protein
MGRELFDKLGSAGNGELNIAEDYECGDIQIIVYLANGKLSVKSRNVKRIGKKGFGIDLHNTNILFISV